MTQPSVSAAVEADRAGARRAAHRARGTHRPAHRGRRRVRAVRGRRARPPGAGQTGRARGGGGAPAHAADQRGHHRRQIARVPQLIQAFRERRPEVEISLDVGNRELVFQRVLDHKVDVAVTGRIPDDDRLVGVDFADNEFVLITSADDPLARRRWVRIEELATRPWLLREPGSGDSARFVEEFLASRGIEPNVLTLGSNGAIKQAAPNRARDSDSVTRRRWSSSSSSACSPRSLHAAACPSAAGTWCAARSAPSARTRRPSWRSAPHPRPGTPSPASRLAGHEPAHQLDRLIIIQALVAVSELPGREGQRVADRGAQLVAAAAAFSAAVQQDVSRGRPGTAEAAKSSLDGRHGLLVAVAGSQHRAGCGGGSRTARRAQCAAARPDPRPRPSRRGPARGSPRPM